MLREPDAFRRVGRHRKAATMFDQHTPARHARAAGARPPYLRVVPAAQTACSVVASARAAQEARDAALLAAVAHARDTAALAKLRACHGHAVEDAAVRLGALPEAAEAIADDAFAQLWERAWRLAAKRVHVRSWLLAVARAAAIAQKRALRADTPSEAVYDPLMIELAPALAVLPAMQRRVIELRYFERLSFAQVAARTGESVDRVKSHARVGVEALRRTFI